MLFYRFSARVRVAVIACVGVTASGMAAGGP